MASQAVESRFTRYRNKLREKSVGAIVRDRLSWYRKRFEMDNWFVGKTVELTGNRVRMHGLKFSVDNPLVSTRHKSTLYFGRYEIDEIRLARQFLNPDIPIVEMGGSIGVVACVTNHILRQPERHVVVEASPALVPTLEANRALNGCKFSIEHAAVAYNTDAVNFSLGGHFLFNRIDGTENTVSVKAVTLGQLLEKYQFETINLISDIEGAEIEVVEHEPELLRTRVKMIVMETHAMYSGEAKVSAMLAQLAKLGFDPLVPFTPGDTAVAALVNRNL